MLSQCQKATGHLDMNEDAITHSEDQVHRLIDILTQEVSLVDRAANKRRFLVVKREDEMNGQDARTNESGANTTNENRPHSTNSESNEQALDISKNVGQLILEAYKTLSMLCSKLEPGKELDEDSYQVMDKLRSLFGQYKNAKTEDPASGDSQKEDTKKQEMKCMYCTELAVKEYTCKDGKKLYACQAHLANAEKDANEKHEGVESAVEIKEASKTQKATGCEFCEEDAVKMVICEDGVKIPVCEKHMTDAQQLAKQKHGGVKSVGGMNSPSAKADEPAPAPAPTQNEPGNENDVNKAGAKLSKPRRKAMRDAVELLISLLKEVMPQDELSKWPLARKVKKSEQEIKLEKNLADTENENKTLREELAKARNSVGMSNISSVEEIPQRSSQKEGVDWPSDMNDLRS